MTQICVDEHTESYFFQILEHYVSQIENAREYCRQVGVGRFRRQIEKKCGIRLGQVSSGRPGKDEMNRRNYSPVPFIFLIVLMLCTQVRTLFWGPSKTSIIVSELVTVFILNSIGVT